MTLHARGVLLAPGEEFVLGLDAGSSGFQVRADFEPQDARIELCPLLSFDGAVAGACIVDLAWGVRTPVIGLDTGALRFRALNQGVTLDLVVEYFERSRSVSVRLPRVPPAPSSSLCEDNACNPLFELTPVRGGTLTAEASFAGEGELAVLEGRVIGRSQTATGVPYRVAAQDSGASPLSAEATLSASDEYAVVVRQEPGPAAQGLSDVVVRIVWP